MAHDAFLQGVRAGGPAGLAWSGLPAGAAAYALSELARGRRGALLAVAPTRDEADDLYRELRFYLQKSDVAVALLPADDVRTWDGLSPHPDIPRQRLQTLDLAGHGSPLLVVAPARALQQRVLPPETLAALRIELARGQVQERDALVRGLVDRGYLATPHADEPGTVAWRGFVVDAWPPGRPGPVRIEFFDDEVESIHQMVERPGTPGLRSAGPLDRVVLLPAREALVTPAALARASEITMAAVDAMGGGQATRRRVLAELKEGLWFPGAEDYLAALHPVVDPLAFLAATARPRLVVLEPDRVKAELERFDELATSRWHSLVVDERPVMLPEVRFAGAARVRADLAGALRLGLLVMDEEGHLGEVDFAARDNADLQVVKGEVAPVAARLGAWLDEGWQVVLVCDSRARSERVAALLQPHGLQPVAVDAPTLPPPGRLGLWLGPLGTGFHCDASRIAVVTADELFAGKDRSGLRADAVPRTLREAALSTVAQLKVHDFVVHARHGIGRFEGLKRIGLPSPLEPALSVAQDFAEITYRDGDRMYLPVTRLDQLFQYRAAGDHEPRLDKLGGQTWAKRKARVRDKVLAMAHELLQLHAMRAIREGHRYQGEPDLLRQLAETFPYVETPDQERAIAEVMADLASDEAMDRLLVGDVGFGKTEVAMRAAMRVVLDGKQVAVLCPTTVLAFQHHQTFTERLGGFGVNIELVSRFRSPREVREVLEAASEGKVDVVIGTHALLGRNARFRDLGLVVVDEEHRFGVRQKQQLKRLARTASGIPCEYLAMSATPIPRTLHMALSGLRSVSMIATPPAGRRAVQTRLLRWNDARIREEILHELKRGGQVFFIHNRIQTIGQVALRLQALVPEARIAVAHGQMEEQHLERVLVDFVRREYHVLLCTTIVESGVDMPNVNTMIVNDAHQLGLAQLYQLRGRVGRSPVRGYCTLLVPESGELTPMAVRRLRVLQEHTELGAGFAIASADMELRGAGDLLGDSQHGHIEAVGLDTYVELLEDAVHAARGEAARQRLDPELEIPVPAFIPEDWLPDTDERLLEYRRIATARTVQQVRDIVRGWEGEWGEPPPEVLNLGWLAEARVRCRELGIERLAWLKVRALLDFHETTPVTPERVVALVSAEPQRFALDGQDAGRRRLAVRFTPEEAQYPFRFLHWVFRRLES